MSEMNETSATATTPPTTPATTPGSTDVLDVFAPPDLPDAAPRPPRRRLRAVVRWTTAVVLFAGLGTGTAFAVLAPARTDLPGLATPPDGRWAFPALALPKLPAGAADPTQGSNLTHAADLRGLLLPEPAKAVDDRTLPGSRGWYPMPSFAARFTPPDEVTARLGELGGRQIAARGWTMPDGTRTEIYLVSFRSQDTASKLLEEPTSGHFLPADAGGAVQDSSGDPGINDFVTGVSISTYTQTADGAQQKPARVAYISAGDVDAVVVMTNPHQVSTVDFDQVIDLQAELLG
jgi:hypothetical protein